MVDLLDALSGKELFVENYERSTSKSEADTSTITPLDATAGFAEWNGIRDPRSHALVAS